MKFRTEEDKIHFLIEAGRPDLIGKPIHESNLSELWQGIIKRRRPLKKRLKDRKRSQIQKANWRKYRSKYLLAIRKWHRSVDGKRFHRALGKFLALRFPRGETYHLSPEERYELLKLLSSYKTHWYIEGAYYKPLLEEVEYELFIEEVLPLIEEIEKQVLTENTLSKEDFEFLIDLLFDERLYSVKDAIERFREGYNNPKSTQLTSCYARCGKYVREHGDTNLIFALVSCLNEPNKVNHGLLLSQDKKIVFDPAESSRVTYKYPNISYKLLSKSKTASDCKIVYEIPVSEILKAS